MFKIIIKIFNHPLNKKARMAAIVRFFKWQIFSRLFKYPVILPFTNNSRYMFWNGLTGLTGNWYYGLMEMEEMAFAAHFLRSDDVFYDVGANVGAYSILTSQHCNCRVYCFEPHPLTFKFLMQNIKIQDNPNLINAYNFALGANNEIVNFTSTLDTVNHVSVDELETSIRVEVKVLDYLSLPTPTLIKIDVEGFESSVLQGAENVLMSSSLKAIIIELNGSGLKYGYYDSDIHEKLLSYGFLPYAFNPFKRKLIQLDTYSNHNTIYLRDYNFCADRLNSAGGLKLSNGVVL